MLTSWNKRETFDRFSNIPDDVVHEILCFLPIKDIARSSLVSKRFRQLCLSVPDLFLDLIPHNRSKVSNWIDRFLTLRNGAKLRRFVLKDACLNHEGIIRVCKWICKAEELDLSFGMYAEQCFLLPPFTFVRAIKLNILSNGGILELPSSTSNSFSLLQDLDIRGIRLDPHNLSEDWVSSLFPAIKKLNLEEVRDIKYLNITSSSLECLSIKTCHLHRVVVSAERLHTLCVVSCHAGGDWLFKIYAPNLQNIRWTADGYSFNGSFMCLKGVNIDAPRLELLQFINHAKSVTLRANILKELFIQDSLPYTMLDNVQNLNLQVSCKMDHKMPALASFFGRLPNLNTLTMRCIDRETFGCDGSNNFDFDIEYWESQDVAFIHQLKEVKIEIRKWECEVGLIKYLIKHAKVLDTMTITFSSKIHPSRSRSIREKLSKFYESFPIATLDFVLK
ncbi:putative F-box/FBD/LRR-repeat protein At4g03220 [Cornus florida]|uniref:putative F-box/FBD/LRR-repeat protein At4g03220 n=1 Tax=Cornus florida TaxID=4283 RepID=UPI00289DEA35|nr:putative F-box/FBD/LRR-repeat protein At4g03220 [Cornus florida]